MREEKPTEVTLTFRDQRSISSATPQIDESAFSNWKVSISNEVRDDLKRDLSQVLALPGQPTHAQLRAALTQEPGISLEGAAQCGKTTTIALRALVLNHYLGFPAESICVLVADVEAKVAMTSMLARYFSQLGHNDAQTRAGGMVQTLPEAVLDVARSVPGLERIQLFGLEESGEAGYSPYAQRLPTPTYRRIDNFASALYTTNKLFAQATVDLYRESLVLPRLEPGHPDVVKRSTIGWSQESVDESITDAVQQLWIKARAWPIEGITPEVSEIDLCGKAYRCHGYAEQLGAHVILGFDRREDRNIRRSPDARLELYKEVEIKKTMIRAYAGTPVIHLDSYEQARNLAVTLGCMAKEMPPVNVSGSVFPTPRPLSMAVWEVVSFIEQLGLDVRASISKCSFLPGDPDALVLRVVSLLWSAYETYLLDAGTLTMTYGRLLSTFAGSNGGNLRYVPAEKLSRYRHILVDDAQELSPAAARWVRSLLLESKKRAEAGSIAPATLFFAGDPLGRMLGSRGASVQPLQSFADFFGLTRATPITLQDNFTGDSKLVSISEAAAAQLNRGHLRQTTALRTDGDASVEVMPLLHPELVAEVRRSLASGLSVLVIPDGPETYSTIAGLLLPVMDEERKLGSPTRVFVRQASKAREVEADTIIMVGGFESNIGSAFRNQIFRMAGQGAVQDQHSYRTAQQEDGAAAVASCLARAKQRVVWFGPGSKFKEMGWLKATLQGG